MLGDDEAGSVSGPSRIKGARFTAEHLPPGQRHEAWANRDWPSVSPLYETTPIGVNARSVGYAFSDMKLWFSQITGQRYERTARAARTHGFDHLCVFMGWAGSAVGEAGDRSYHRRPGDLMLVDIAQADRQIGNGDDCVSLMIPRALAETVLPPVEKLHGLVIPAEKAALLSSVLQGMRATLGGLDDSAVPRLRRVLLDILAITLAEVGRATEPAPAARGAAVGLRARREIEAGLGSATLSVANLCRRLGVSRSTLHRAFQHEGGVEAYIRDRRLAAVHAALSDSTERRPIVELAEAFGFSDGAHLSRLFRSRYGMTPTDHRFGARR